MYKPYGNDIYTGSIDYPNIDYLESTAAIKLKDLDLSTLLLIFEFLEDGSTDKAALKALKKDFIKSIKEILANDNPLINNYILSELTPEY